jgi:hypothetical protein
MTMIMRVILAAHVGDTLQDMPPVRRVLGGGTDGRVGSSVRALPKVMRSCKDHGNNARPMTQFLPNQPLSLKRRMRA